MPTNIWLQAHGAPSAPSAYEWYIAEHRTDRAALAELYKILPARLPPIYERLVLTYRRSRIDLGLCRLLSNRSDRSLLPPRDEIIANRVPAEVLLRNGVIQFARGPEEDYDPVCFDARVSRPECDYAIIRLDHEDILCRGVLSVTDQIAPSFRTLVQMTIAAGKRAGKS